MKFEILDMIRNRIIEIDDDLHGLSINGENEGMELLKELDTLNDMLAIAEEG